MEYNLEPLISKKIYGEEIIGVYDNSIYFSTKTRFERKIKGNERFQFFCDKINKVVAIKRVDDGGVRMNLKGYCKTRIEGIMPNGKYYFEQEKDGFFIFKGK